MEQVLKVLLKLGLKVVAPVTGELTAGIAETLGTELLDAREKSKADEVATRVLKKLRSDAAAWLAQEGLAVEATAPLYATVEALAGDTARLNRLWADAAFDPTRAAELSVSENAHLMTQLTAAEQDICRMLLRATFAALVGEQKALEATEAQFRRGVMQRLEVLAERVSRGSEQEQESLRRVVTSAALSIRSLRWRAELFPPGALLRADIDDPVPFHGRESELHDLMAWCQTAKPVCVRLYTGAGGIGKTRLLREAARRLNLNGWRAGFLESTAGLDSAFFWSGVSSGTERRLYAVDYAENRRPQVIRLLKELLQSEPEQPRRVVLLARASDEWWDQMKAEPDGVGDLLTGPSSALVALGPHTASIEARRHSFTVAATHFAGKLQRAAPEQAPGDLDADAFARPLLLHMAALAAVEGVGVAGDQGILDYVLRRERRFWAQHAAQRGLPEQVVRGIGRAMAAFTLAGGCATPQRALVIMQRIPFFADQTIAIVESVAELLHDVYPGERWIEPVLPDLLGEHLCQVELDEAPDELFALVFDEEAA